MGCSPAVTAPQTLRTRASCSPCRPAQENPTRPKWQSTNPACCRVHVRAAGAACSSSRPSCASARLSTEPQRLQLGSTPRDAYTIAQQTKSGSLLVLALRRKPRCSPRHTKLSCSQSRKTQNLVVQSPIARPRLNSRSATAANPATLQLRFHTHASIRGEIPIAPAAPPLHTFRDFVPWRFSAAGRHSTSRPSSLPAAENLHRLGKARGEHNESGVPQKAEVVGALSHFRVGPILLQKDFAHPRPQDWFKIRR